jgi:dihydroorotase
MILEKVRQPLVTLILISCHPTTVDDVQEIRAQVNSLLADMTVNHAILRIIAAPAERSNE